MSKTAGMSLNGLKEQQVLDAFNATIAEPAGWYVVLPHKVTQRYTDHSPPGSSSNMHPAIRSICWTLESLASPRLAMPYLATRKSLRSMACSCFGGNECLSSTYPKALPEFWSVCSAMRCHLFKAILDLIPILSSDYCPLSLHQRKVCSPRSCP